MRPTNLQGVPVRTTPPIVLIHGLWLTPRSWEGWKARFEQRGHEASRRPGLAWSARSKPSAATRPS
jgi:pimeloyl-ACP methyl ester carboxylesterase